MREKRQRRTTNCLSHSAMRMYSAILQHGGKTHNSTRPNAIPVLAKPVFACDSQLWIHFNSMKEAQKTCFGTYNANIEFNTKISQCARSGKGSVFGWKFKLQS
jgi:sulfur transfer protein SufE